MQNRSENNVWLEKIRQLNSAWNDLPRRGAVVAGMLLLLFLAGKLFRFVAPSVLAMAFAWIITPLSKLLERGFQKLRLPAKAASLIAVLLMYGVILWLLALLGARLMKELQSLIAAVPGWVAQAVEFLRSWSVEGEGFALKFASEELTSFVNIVLPDVLTQVSGVATSMVANMALRTIDLAKMLPQIILFVVLTIMGTFYMVADRQRIFCFLNRWMPNRASGRFIAVRNSVFRGIAGQIRAALILMVMVTAELMIGFTLLRLPYAALLAILIAVMDALPIIGAGLFLLPMSLYGFIVGDLTLGAGVAGLYALVVISRQIAEPRLVSVQLGLYPLVTMAAMYAGLTLIGFGGMLLAPVVVLILKVALANEESATPVDVKPHRFRKRKKNGAGKPLGA